MGASRKLQGEIDRVLKKVQEGLEVFNSLWNKVHDKDNKNMKDKYKTDLRKEIKKLQRHRDQIKTWLQSNEIKDEKALTDARNRIEKEMDRFKICEKETKTKAFSTEGLEQQPKMDPKEKAKSETRDWLNNTVSELKSQIESFEAQTEGLFVKKGKTRPPRLTHLELSISRHKAHIMKLEFILRLLDNDELSPEQVNDVKDILDDYVERNQEDFDEFDDVDMLYNTSPLDKLESLEDLAAIRPPSLVKGVGAAPSIKSPFRRSKAQKDLVTIRPPGVIKGVGAAPSMKSPFSRSKAQQDLVTIRPPAAVKGVGATGAASSMKSPWSMSKAQLLTSATATSSFQHHDSVQEQADGTAPTPPPKNNANSSAPLTSAITQASPVAVGASSVLSGPSSGKGVLDSLTSSVPLSPTNIAAKEEDVSNFPGRKPSSFIPEEGLMDLGATNLPSITIPTTSGGTVSSNGSLGVASGTPRRAILGGDDRLGSSGIVQPLVSPLSSRMTLPPSAKTSDVFSGSSSGGNGEVGGMAGRVFPPSGAPGIQWRPGQPFRSQHEGVRGRTEIETREEFLQRFHQQVQQKGQGNNLGITSLSGGNHKQSTSQQDLLFQQFNSQSSAASPQGGLVGGPAAGLIAATSAQQQPSSIHSLSGRHTLMSSGSKDTEPDHVKAEEPQQRQSLSDESATSSVLDKNTANKDDSKVSYTSDAQAGVSGSVSDPLQVTRDICLSHGQKSTMQLLESSFHKLPQPEDYKHAKSYNPRHPAKTSHNYPQEQAPIVGNPAFWECLGFDSVGLDTLFFAFYYQQNTDHQYLAARELKKRSWRYHKMWNTWFHVHEEQPVVGDGYEQGTYVYFDHDGWCQSIADFRFDYQDIENELV